MDVLIPAIAALLGALLGAAASFLGAYVQARKSDKRGRVAQIVQLALAEADAMEKRAERVRLVHPGQPMAIPPITLHLYYHGQILQLIENGDYSPESWPRKSAQPDK